MAKPESNIERVNVKHIVNSSSESDCSDDDTENSLMVIPTPKQGNLLQHPHFGGKRPKQYAHLSNVSISCAKKKNRRKMMKYSGLKKK